MLYFSHKKYSLFDFSFLSRYNAVKESMNALGAVHHLLVSMVGRTRKFTLPPPLSEYDATPKVKANRRFSIYKGLFLAMMSGFCFSIVSVIVKEMENMSASQLTMYRFLSILVFSMPPAVKSQENLLGPKDMRFSLVLCGLVGVANIFFTFMALKYLPLGEATVIVFSVSAFVAVAARIFLKEPFGIFLTVAVSLTIVGIILTTKLPLKLTLNSVPYTTESLYGIAAAVMSLLFCTWRYILIRKIKSVHHSIIMFNTCCVALFVSLFLTVIVGGFKWHDCGLGKLKLVSFGLFSYIGLTAVITSLQCEMAAPVSIMRSGTDIILAFIWQITLFHDIPDALSISGAVLVGFSVMLVGLNKWATSLPPGSSYTKYVGWMTR